MVSSRPRCVSIGGTNIVHLGWKLTTVLMWKIAIFKNVMKTLNSKIQFKTQSIGFTRKKLNPLITLHEQTIRLLYHSWNINVENLIIHFYQNCSLAMHIQFTTMFMHTDPAQGCVRSSKNLNSISENHHNIRKNKNFESEPSSAPIQFVHPLHPTIHEL